ncbi:MAG: hypothetical protein WCT22_02665 [Patescibacteria group bacterium]|jgi:hypothetical protein
MLETTRQNFDGERIMSNMANFKKEVGEMAHCYDERNPNPSAPSGIVRVGMKLENTESERLVDKIARKNNGFSPYGWRRMDPRHMTFASKYQSINGYKFT